MNPEALYPHSALLANVLNSETSLSTERCDRIIYDEVLPVDNPDLLAVIGSFANKNVEVRVQLVKSMADEGFELTEEGNDYTATIIEECDWDIANAVTIVVSSDPRYFNIAMSGRQADYDDSHPGAMSNVTDTFIGALREGGPDTYQADVAKTLQMLYTNEFESQIHVPSSPTPGVVQPPKEAKPEINIPVAEIGGAAIGVAAIAGVATQLIRRKGIRTIRDKFEVSSREHLDVTSSAVHSIEAVDSLTKILPEDDALELRRLEAEVHAGYKAWREALEAHSNALRAESRRFWPSKSEAHQLTDTYAQDSEHYIDLVHRHNAEREEIQHKLDSIESIAASSRNLQLSVFDKIDSLRPPSERQGDVVPSDTKIDQTYYDTKILDEKFENAKAIIASAIILRDTNHIDKPYDFYQQANAELQEIIAFVDALPAFHRDLIKDKQANDENQANRTVTLDELEAVISTIKSEFGASCWGDVDQQYSAAKKNYDLISSRLETIGSPTDELSIAKLVEDREGITEITGYEDTFVRAENAIHTHAHLLDRLRAELPRTVQSLIEAQDAAEVFVEKHAEDIEDPTEDIILGVRAQIERLQGDLKIAQPAYLKIDEAVGSARASLERATIQAEAERNEMIELRKDIDRLEDDVQQAIDTAVRYEAGHSDVDSQTESDIASLDLPNVPRARQRAALRQAKQLYIQALNNARKALNDAKNDVKREEQARERAREQERQARAAREAAERARTSFNSSSFGSSSSRTRNNSGGF